MDAATRMKEVRDAVLDVVQHWPNFPPINIYVSASELPEAALRMAKHSGENPRNIAAVWHGGQMHINCQHPLMRTRTGIEKALFHELWGHYGLRVVLGDGIREHLNNLTEALGGPVGLEDLARRYRVWDDLQHYFNSSHVWPPSARNALLLDELIAHLHEKGPPGVKQRVAEYMGAIKNWFAERGFKRLAKLNALDLAYLMRQSRRAVTQSSATSLVTDRVVAADASGTRFKVAWHGSPTPDIQRFSMSHVGTGEGATAYGYGMYFAGRESIGEAYRLRLTRPAWVKDDGATLTGQAFLDDVTERFGREGRAVAARVMALRDEHYGSLDQAVDALAGDERVIADRVFAGVRRIPSLPASNRFHAYSSAWGLEASTSRENAAGWVRLNDILQVVEQHVDTQRVPEAARAMLERSRDCVASPAWAAQDEAALAILDHPDTRIVDMRGSGQLYKVDVPADRDLLDWDRPLDEQPQRVREILAAMDATDIPALAMWQGGKGGELTGQDVYADMVQAHERDVLHQAAKKAASEQLLAAGIPGLRYLDGLSRGERVEDLAHNYVIWDEMSIDILETRYAIKDVPDKLPAAPEAALRRHLMDLRLMESYVREHGGQGGIDAIEAAVERIEAQVMAYEREMERQGIDAQAVIARLNGTPAAAADEPEDERHRAAMPSMGM